MVPRPGLSRADCLFRGDGGWAFPAWGLPPGLVSGKLVHNIHCTSHPPRDRKEVPLFKTVRPTTSPGHSFFFPSESE